MWRCVGVPIKMDAPPINFAADAKVDAEPDQLDRIVSLAERMDRLELLIAEQSDRLKELAQERDAIATRHLPDALTAAKMLNFTLMDGREIGVEQEVYCGITKAKAAEAFAWLRSTNNDAIIKRVIAIRFGKGDDKRAAATHEKLKELLKGEVQITDQSAVHPQTLTAFVKECLREGEPIPEELFGIHKINRATIRSPKK